MSFHAGSKLSLLGLVVFSTAVAICQQAAPSPVTTPTPLQSPTPALSAPQPQVAINTVPPAAPSIDQLQARISRARALAAAHSLDAAATELNLILTATNDDSVKDVARILLMDVYLEQADYTKAQSLLETAYSANASSTTGTYFALAGQAVNGAREHIARYRALGLNPIDPSMAPEAVNDLNKLRMLLERLNDQAKELSGDNEKATDAIALREDVAGVRIGLARDAQERAQWQQIFESSRQKLAVGETRVPRPAKSVNSQPTPAPVSPAPTPTPQPTPVSSGSGSASAPGNKNSVSNPGAQPAAAAAPAVSDLVDLGSLTDKATKSPKPSYPQIAKTARVSGEVIVYVEVDENGAVSKIERATGPMLLVPAAEDASKKWKFQPTVVNGQPAKVRGFITFRFTAAQ